MRPVKQCCLTIIPGVLLRLAACCLLPAAQKLDLMSELLPILYLSFLAFHCFSQLDCFCVFLRCFSLLHFFSLCHLMSSSLFFNTSFAFVSQLLCSALFAFSSSLRPLLHCLQLLYITNHSFHFIFAFTVLQLITSSIFFSP